MRIVDNLHAYVWGGRDNNANAYVFKDALRSGRHLLIDPGHLVTPYYREPGLEILLEEMERDGIRGSSIGLIFLTHGHPDHCEAAIALRHQNQVPVALHEADAGSFRALGGETDYFLQEGALEICGGARLQVLHSPGHTPGHVTLYWPDRKALIAGDCIFYRGMGRADLPGGSPQELMKTIEKLSRLKIEHLLSGHAYGNSGIITGVDEVRENFRYLLGF